MSNTPRGGDYGKYCKPNSHHNVPSSRGGSDHEVNLSDVPVQRHADLHQWLSNRTACQGARYMGLHAIANGNSGIGDERLDTLFQLTTVLNWSILYEPQAFRPTVSIEAMEQSINEYGHFKTQILEEIVWVRKTVEALNGTGSFPSEHHSFLPDALHFFSTNSPRKAIEGLFTEEHFGMRSWVKPMRTEKRDLILRTVKSPKEKNESRHRDTQEILRRQEKRLVQQKTEIETFLTRFGCAATLRQPANQEAQ